MAQISRNSVLRAGGSLLRSRDPARCGERRNITRRQKSAREGEVQEMCFESEWARSGACSRRAGARLAPLVWLAAVALSHPGLAQTYLKVHDQEFLSRPDIRPAATSLATPSHGIASAPGVCGPARRAWRGQPVPGGGTLDPAAFAAPATI